MISFYDTYSSISWNGLSQTGHLVSPSSSSSLSSSTVPLCCEATSIEKKRHMKRPCRKRNEDRLEVIIPFHFVTGCGSINYNPENDDTWPVLVWANYVIEKRAGSQQRVAWQVDAGIVPELLNQTGTIGLSIRGRTRSVYEHPMDVTIFS